MKKRNRDQYRGHRGMQAYRSARAKGKEIAVACAESPAIADAYNQALGQGHPRDRAWEIAQASERKARYSPSVSEEIDTHDRKTVSSALVTAEGNRTQAAEALGISRTTLRRRMSDFGMI